MYLPLLSLGLIKTITKDDKTSNQINQNTYATDGFEGTCYNKCAGSYLSSYRPFSSNLQIPKENSQEINREQNWSKNV